MQVMIVEEDPTLRTRITGALAPEGVDILSFGRLAPAKAAARRASVDILVLGESVEGRLASDVALLAEWRNPRLGSILLSNREGDDADELYELIPSLQAVLARQTGPRTLARVAMATARSQEGVVLLHEDDSGGWEDQGEPLPAGEAGPGDACAPAPEMATPEGAGVSAVTPEVPDPDQDDSDLIRAVLAQVGPQPGQEVSAAAAPIREVSAPEPAASLRPVPDPDALSGRLYVLPNFLRDEGTHDEEERDDEENAPPTPPHASMIPVQPEAPMRRLNLA